MQYTKPMVDLIREIRRRVDDELKPQVRFANPELPSALAEVYHTHDNAILRALIKELFSTAGDGLPSLLDERSSTGKRIYRGRFQDRSPKGEFELPSPAQRPDKPVRYYRGVKVG